MKKAALSAVVALMFLIYAYHQRNEESLGMTEGLSNSSSISSNAPSASGQPGTNSSPSSPKTAGVKDGSYTGNVADAFYGNVQVKVVIQSGKLTDVQFLQYPNDRGQSIMINSQAMPDLTSEAIQAQNAQVDTVTGATQTSEAFRESLQSALDQARG